MDWLLVTCATVAVAKLSSARPRIGLWKSRSAVESDASIPREPHPSCPGRRIHPAHHGELLALSCEERGSSRGGRGVGAVSTQAA